MNKGNHDGQILDPSNAEYVVLQTGKMNSNNKSVLQKIDNLSLLLQESDSVTNFRFYLDSINCGHFLDFWFACQGFKNFDRSDTHKLYQLTKVIYRAYIRTGSPYAVPLKQNTKKVIVDKLSDRKCFDQSIFDVAQMEIREILSGEFLINFLQSDLSINSKQSEKIPSIVPTSSNSNSKIQEHMNDVPVTSSSSSGHIGRRHSVAKFNMVGSRSSEAVIEGNYNVKNVIDNSMGQTYTTQNPGTITSVLNNNNSNNLLGNNGSGNGSKDRKNLSELDPSAFSKLLSNKLEEVDKKNCAVYLIEQSVNGSLDLAQDILKIVKEQAKFEKILCLVKSVSTESDTDDNSSSAISYLMRCHWSNSQDLSSNRLVDGDLVETANVLVTKATSKLKSAFRSGDIRDDHAHDILENHCSRIGLDEPGVRHCKRDLSEGKKGWRREHDLGSITSYDSGVATSLEQYSNLGIPGSILENISWQKNNFLPLNSNEMGNDSSSSHKYHHHYHHHHHHKSHLSVNKSQKSVENANNNGLFYYKDALTKNNNISEVSSNFDSGISSTYEYMGRRFQPMNDKVTNWISQNSNITSNSPHNIHDSNITSGIPPNTPLISIRGFTSPSYCDIYPNPIYMFPKPIKQPNLYSAVPEYESVPHQSLENWLELQASVSTPAFFGKNENIQKTCYCSTNVESTRSELIKFQDSLDSGESNFNETRTNISGKESNTSKVNSTKSNSLVVGYYIGNDPVPYRTQIPDAHFITLGQFKSIVAKKGPFRYFFKRYCDEFDCGAVHEEITRDDAILPLWEGKVVAKIEKAE